MLIRLILAVIAVISVAGWPRNRLAAATALGAGTLSGGIFPATIAAAPMLVFLTVGLGLAGLAERAGFVDRGVTILARAGKGSTRRLYVLVCSASALLTAVVSLDGAVVLMVPVVSTLARRYRIAFAPFFLGVVAVANAASLAVPEGNPTNLVIMSRLGVSPDAFLLHLFLPGVCASILCALVPLRRLNPRRYATYPIEGAGRGSASSSSRGESAPSSWGSSRFFEVSSPRCPSAATTSSLSWASPLSRRPPRRWPTTCR